MLFVTGIFAIEMLLTGMLLVTLTGVPVVTTGVTAVVFVTIWAGWAIRFVVERTGVRFGVELTDCNGATGRPRYPPPLIGAPS